MKMTMRKIVILMMAVLVCVAMLSSVLFMAEAAGHACTHEDCAICYHISVCMNMLKSFSMALVLLSIVIAAHILSCFAVLNHVPHFQQPTLITNKVKLSD